MAAGSQMRAERARADPAPQGGDGDSAV